MAKRKPKLQWDVFISHNGRQKDWVRQVVKQWRELGLKVFFDEDCIEPGEDIVKGIERGLQRSCYVVLIISPQAMASRWVAMEIAITVYQDPDAQDRRLIPVELVKTDRETLPFSIWRLKRTNLTDPKTRIREYQSLLKSIGAKKVDSPPPLEIVEADVLADTTIEVKGTKVERSRYTKERVLIVDDDLAVADRLRQVLNLEGYQTNVAVTAEDAEQLLRKHLYDVALIDLRMPEAGGIEMMARCRQIDPAIAVMILTAFSTVENATQAFRLGAKDFLAKPIRRDDLLAAIERVLESSRLAREARDLRGRAVIASSFDRIVGKSETLRKQIDLAQKVSESDMPVLIQGETGTGKDLIAAAVHDAGPRSKRAMVTAVVGARPHDLQKSELFGHVKGAFTGADVSHRGCFQSADQSTLFLDEIGDVSLETQVALLRAIEQKRIRPVGSDQEIDVDVRILAATNRDLNAEVRAGRFREDLLHRLGGPFLIMPPLRERAEDIPALVAHLLQQTVGPGKEVPPLEPETLDLLQRYPWPGNVRELKNVVERAVLLSSGGPIQPEHCTLYSAASGEEDTWYRLPMKEAQDQFTTAYLEHLLKRCGGDTSAAADEAGVHVTSIRRKIRELGIRE